MKAIFARACALALLASTAACSTMGGGDSGAEVTRFHLGQPIARGQIAVEPVDAADANGLEFRSYAGAVERQLARLGWTIVPAGRSEQVALIDVQQGSRESLRQNGSSVSFGLGAGSGGGWRGGSSVGGGIGIGFPLGGSARDVVGTMLQVSIKRRSDGTVFWEGRATTEAREGTPGAQRTIAVEKLADALFRDFPGESGRTISVR
jgi:uncharacterized protein DUF4136